MGVYDYSPKLQSPNSDLVTQELAFQMGDIIRVYGEQRGDGYFFAKVSSPPHFAPLPAAFPHFSLAS